MSLTSDQLRERLDVAIDFGGGKHSMEDLVRGVAEGQMQCIYNDSAISFTQIEPRHDRRVLNIYLAAGELEAVMALQEQWLELARQEGCTSLVCHGRPGWLKTLPKYGWTVQAVTWDRAL